MTWTMWDTTAPLTRSTTWARSSLLTLSGDWLALSMTSPSEQNKQTTNHKPQKTHINKLQSPLCPLVKSRSFWSRSHKAKEKQREERKKKEKEKESSQISFLSFNQVVKFSVCLSVCQSVFNWTHLPASQHFVSLFVKSIKKKIGNVFEWSSSSCWGHWQPCWNWAAVGSQGLSPCWSLH